MQNRQGDLKCFIKEAQLFWWLVFSLAFFVFFILLPLATTAGDGGNDFVTNIFDIYIFYLMLLDISNLL